MDEQYKSLEKLCKSNNNNVIQLLDSGITPSLQCLLYACKVDSNSGNIIKLIDKGILPNKHCLLRCCNSRNNSNGIIKIIRSGVKPCYECLRCKKIYTNDNYDAFVEISSYLLISYKELKYACSINESNKSVYYIINTLGIKPDEKCVKKLCKYNKDDYKTLKVLLESNVKIKMRHLQMLSSLLEKKQCMRTILTGLYYYLNQHNYKLKYKHWKITIDFNDMYDIIKLMMKHNINLDEIIV